MRAARWLVSGFLVPLTLGLPGCCLQVGEVGQTPADGGSSPADCAAAGGICQIGPPEECIGTVLSQYDCNPERTPAGGVCCVRADAGADAGVDAGIDAGVDAGPDAGVDAGVDAGSVSSCGPASNLDSAVTYTSGGLDQESTSGLGVDLIASGDLNGDGLLDLVATIDFPYSGFAVFFGQPDGGLSAPTAYPDAGGASAVGIGDIDGDGQPDVVVSAGLGIDVFHNDHGALSLLGSYPTSGRAAGVQIGDLDGDGVPDLLVAEILGDVPVELFLGESGGAFSAPEPLTTLSGTDWGGLVVGDLNGDGLADIVGNSPDSLQLAVWLNEGDQKFQKSFIPTPVRGQVALVSQSGGPPDIVLGDVGNGEPGGSDSLDAGVQVLLNSGEGAFSLGGGYRVPGGDCLAVGDFNGDCVLDVATSSWRSSGIGGRSWGLTVLFGDGDGGFGGQQILRAVGTCPGGLAPLGPVGRPRALAVGDSCGAGITVYGDASR